MVVITSIKEYELWTHVEGWDISHNLNSLTGTLVVSESVSRCCECFSAENMET